MSDYDENEEEPAEDEGLRGLRQAKKAAEERATKAEADAEAGRAAMRREAARDAGLDLTNKTTAKFMEHYEGDFTPDAMKAAAVEWGIMPDVEQAAQESVQGQTQMASAYSGGETQPLGTVTVGDRQHRVEVPAAEAEKWQAFEAAVKSGDMQAGAEVLSQYGHSLEGIGDVEYEPGAGAPHTTPISGRPL